ncbi:MAG TPA: AAA family ATPase, partial [Planctomycetota bacterium]|nr:AAA family ATPase [Planctomycetota bacterium]
MKQGKIYIISGPSGVGKTTICKELCNHIPRLRWSISATTRPQRLGEINGRDYYFLTQKQFSIKVEQNEFLEHAQVHGNYYGTPIAPIQQGLEQGDSYLLDIDV